MIIAFCRRSKLLMEYSFWGELSSQPNSFRCFVKPAKEESGSMSQINRAAESFTGALCTFSNMSQCSLNISKYHASKPSKHFSLLEISHKEWDKQAGVDAGRQVPPPRLAAPTSETSSSPPTTNTIRHLDRSFPLVKKLARPQKSGHPIWDLL